MIYDFDQIIDRKHTYSTQWDFISDRFGKSDLLPFSISDTDFQVPEEIMDDLRNVLEKKIFGYTRWNHHDYKNAICSHYIKKNTRVIDEDWIVYSPSVLYTLSVLLRFLTEPGDSILVFDPMYDAFINVIKKNGRQLVPVSLKNEENFSIDFEMFEEKIKECKVFLFCSPHNPTGRVFTKEEIRRLVDICSQHHTVIISDEIHSDILLFGNKFHSVIDWLDEYPQIILVNSASKTFNIPGLGGSYAVIPQADLRKDFLVQTRQRDFVNSPSLLGMIATMSGYLNGDDYIAQLTSYIEGNMEYTKEFLESNFVDVKMELPQATYLAWIDIRQLPFSANQVQEALVNEGRVGIMPGETYGANGAGYLRMNLGCPRLKVQEGLQRMKNAFSYLSGDSYVK